MLKYLFSILLSLIIFNSSLANDINIQENIKLTFVCDLDKKIIKNSEYNYQTFLAKDLNEKGLDRFEIEAVKPEKLYIKGLSLFLSKSEKLNVKIVKVVDSTGNGIFDSVAKECVEQWVFRPAKYKNENVDVFLP